MGLFPFTHTGFFLQFSIFIFIQFFEFETIVKRSTSFLVFGLLVFSLLVFGLLVLGSKTQNVEEISLDLIFHNNFWWNIKSFSKQNTKLRIHSKPDRNQWKLTVCNGYYLGQARIFLKMPILFSKKTTKRGGGGQKSQILRRHSLWTPPNSNS